MRQILYDNGLKKECITFEDAWNRKKYLAS